ncbi:MAG: biotin transporter BioY [Parachlamydiaceae bacterium]
MMHLKAIQIDQTAPPISWVKTSTQIFLGALYITLLSQIEIPLQPIPVTMQTFAIFSLALFQGSKNSSFSVALYLFAATLGLPVLSPGYVNPLWFLAPSAGYCLSFPLATYVIGKLTEIKSPLSTGSMFIAMCSVQCLIYVMGVAWLTTFVGFKEALMMGVYPFVLFDAIKVMAALSVKMAAKYANHDLHLFIRR